MSADDSIRDDRPAAASLSLRSFLVCLVIVVALFVGLNPIWRTQEIGAWQQSIVFSYLPIPLLVALFLKIEHKFAVAPMLLETLKLALAKLGITFVLAHAIWIVVGFPSPPATAHAAAANLPKADKPPPSQIAQQDTGTLYGVVADAAGEPVAGALVYVAAGLEQYTFAASTDPSLITVDGAGFNPALAVVQAGQTLTLTSHDTELHTAVLSDARGQSIANLAVVPGGDRTAVFERCPGVVTMRCAVHRDGEPQAHLLITCNPFFALTGADGRFELPAVPAGALKLSVWTAAGASANTSVELSAGQRRELQLSTR